MTHLTKNSPCEQHPSESSEQRIVFPVERANTPHPNPVGNATSHCPQDGSYHAKKKGTAKKSHHQLLICKNWTLRSGIDYTAHGCGWRFPGRSHPHRKREPAGFSRSSGFPSARLRRDLPVAIPGRLGSRLRLMTRWLRSTCATKRPLSPTIVPVAPLSCAIARRFDPTTASIDYPFS